jgi:hypothetical protein
VGPPANPSLEMGRAMTGQGSAGRTAPPSSSGAPDGGVLRIECGTSARRRCSRSKAREGKLDQRSGSSRQRWSSATRESRHSVRVPARDLPNSAPSVCDCTRRPVRPGPNDVPVPSSR